MRIESSAFRAWSTPTKEARANHAGSSSRNSSDAAGGRSKNRGTENVAQKMGFNDRETNRCVIAANLGRVGDRKSGSTGSWHCSPTPRSVMELPKNDCRRPQLPELLEPALQQNSALDKMSIPKRNGWILKHDDVRRGRIPHRHPTRIQPIARMEFVWHTAEECDRRSFGNPSVNSVQEVGEVVELEVMPFTDRLSKKMATLRVQRLQVIIHVAKVEDNPEPDQQDKPDRDKCAGRPPSRSSQRLQHASKPGRHTDGDTRQTRDGQDS